MMMLMNIYIYIHIYIYIFLEMCRDAKTQGLQSMILFIELFTLNVSAF